MINGFETHSGDRFKVAQIRHERYLDNKKFEKVIYFQREGKPLTIKIPQNNLPKYLKTQKCHSVF